MLVKMLSRDEILESISNVKNGQIVRVSYQSEVPVKAEFKKLGMTVFKFTETSVRTGVNYWNMQSVIARKSNSDNKSKVKSNNPYNWIIKNKVKCHETTGKEYLVVAPLKKGDHTKTFYGICCGGTIIMMSEAEFKKAYLEIVIDSYWTRSKTGEDIKTISFENIIRIGNNGSKLDFNYFK